MKISTVRRLLSVVLLLAGAGLAGAKPPAAETLPFARASLLDQGARGDGHADDTEALRAAFQRSARGLCLDGGGKTFRVTGTLRANGHLCLIDTKLMQMIEPIDTRPYIKSTGREPPIMLATEPARFYPEDPVLDEAQHQALELRNNLRTILVTGNKNSSVYLRGVQVSRGEYETLGNGGNASAIYVVNSNSVRMDDVEVFGKGRGHAIFVTASKNIDLSRINIHDLLWSLDLGDRTFTQAQMKDLYDWNNVPMYAYDPKKRKFGVVRSQEQTSALVISHSDSVKVRDSSIARVLYHTPSGNIPWQADGITMGFNGNVEISKMSIDNVWEGIDLTGKAGVDSFHLTDLTIKNTFNYGLKIVYATRNGVVDRANISYSGINGIVVAGSARDIDINHATIRETGLLILPDGTRMTPYQSNGKFQRNIAGVAIVANKLEPAENPKRIHIRDSTAKNIEHPGMMLFGFSSDVTEADKIVIENSEASGYKVKSSGNSREARDQRK